MIHWGLKYISIHTPAKGATRARRSNIWACNNFNPHTREGCDCNAWCELCQIHRISIHTPAKGATCRFTFRYFSRLYFNPHTREGCDVRYLSITSSLCNFNPHTREGCDCRGFQNAADNQAYFNPHTREGCDDIETRGYSMLSDISIHTPAKGATIDNASFSKYENISIHTPAKGATVFHATQAMTITDFNPHTREGCDGALHGSVLGMDKFQSTHPRRVRPHFITASSY